MDPRSLKSPQLTIRTCLATGYHGRTAQENGVWRCQHRSLVVSIITLVREEGSAVFFICLVFTLFAEVARAPRVSCAGEDPVQLGISVVTSLGEQVVVIPQLFVRYIIITGNPEDVTGLHFESRLQKNG